MLSLLGVQFGVLPRLIPLTCRFHQHDHHGSHCVACSTVENASTNPTSAASPTALLPPRSVSLIDHWTPPPSVTRRIKRRETVAANAHNLNVALGILINVAEAFPPCCTSLATIHVSDPSRCASSASSSRPSNQTRARSCTSLLCRLFLDCQQQEGLGDEDGGMSPRKKGRQSPGKETEVTLEDLSMAEQSGALASTESYW